MHVVTWNVNSVRARIERVHAWLKAHRPDIVCLQEIKCLDRLFPQRELELLGYHCATYGQKTYNGVAILSAHPIHDIRRGFHDLGQDEQDDQARLIAASIQGVDVVCAYVPNGQRVGSEAWDYKIAWLEKLRAQILDQRYDPHAPLLVCGDFNVAPEDRDMWNPRSWHDSIVSHPQARAAYHDVLAFGLHDTTRALLPDQEALYTWWDYRRDSLAKNRGLRIDMILATQPLLDRCQRVAIDREERTRTRPSDHAPVQAWFAPLSP